MRLVEFERIIKYFDGRATPEEAMAIDDWLAESPANRIYFEQLHQSWLESGEEAYTAPDTTAAWNRLKTGNHTPDIIPRKKKSKRLAIWWTAAAAILLVIVLSVWQLNKEEHMPGNDMISQAATGTEKTVFLPDSSFVQLKAGSSIRYRNTKENRELYLSGSSSFHIRHNEQQPWRVYLDSMLIRDIGTVFSIDQTTDSTLVQVTEGAVELSTRIDTVVLEAGQSGIFSRKNMYLKSEHQLILGNFNFEDVSLENAASKLAGYYHVQFFFSAESLKKMRLTASIKQKSLPEIMDVIATTFDIRYKIKNNNVYITGGAIY